MNWFRVVAKDSAVTQEAMYINRREMPEFNMYLPLDNKDYLVVVENGEVSTAKFLSVEEFKYKSNIYSMLINYIVYGYRSAAYIVYNQSLD